MSNDLFLLIIGAIIGLISTLVVEFVKQTIDRWRKLKEREYNENHLREMNLRDFIEIEKPMKNAPIAWLKLVETTTVPSYMRQAPTTETFSPIVRLLSRRKKIIGDDGKYRIIEKIILGKTQLIGRQEDCEISLEDISVSRLHAMIRYDGEDYVLYDMGSTTGTIVNGNPISATGRVLLSGDVIRMGKSSFLFEETFPSSFGNTGRQRRVKDLNLKKKRKNGV